MPWGATRACLGLSLRVGLSRRNECEVSAGCGGPAAQAEGEKSREQKYLSEKMERKAFSKVSRELCTVWCHLGKLLSMRICLKEMIHLS